MNSGPSQNFFSAALISKAARTYKRELQRRALRERWPSRRRGNLIEYTPPRALISKCRKLAVKTKPAGLRAFSITDGQRAEMVRVQIRLAAILELSARLDTGEAYEKALAWVSNTFDASPSSLRRWQRAFSVRGVGGLAEHKRGRVGRKATGHENRSN